MSARTPSGRIFYFLAAFAACFQALPAWGQTVEGFLDEFHRNPEKMMNKLPEEVLPDGSTRSRGFVDEELTAQQLFFRSQLRKEVMQRSLPHWGYTEPIEKTIEIDLLPENKNDPAKLIEPGEILTSLAEMENRNLVRVSLAHPPWSDSYWPTAKGNTAIRYSDPSFPNSGNWLKNYRYIQSRPAAAIARSGNSSAIAQLSPTEKYDLAMGDLSFPLTNYAWKKGERHYNSMGVVPGWFGYCHGWSAAAHMLAPYPHSPVSVVNPAGTEVIFYPQDVKGLLSMLWANAWVKTRFMGNRCNSKPIKDEYGRVTNPKCFDTNPGSWHIALINQLGVHDRSLVMDSSRDFAVWNYPVSGYSYRYFHPETRKEVASLRAAAVETKSYRTDPFRKHRSEKARYVAGIVMDVSYSGAVQPRRGHSVPDIPTTKTIRFFYDLELDESWQIVGGEWYSNAHPDFVWTFDRDAQALAYTDREVLAEGWTAASPVPSSWSDIARRSSSRGEPLYSFIRGLLSGGN